MEDVLESFSEKVHRAHDSGLVNDDLGLVYHAFILMYAHLSELTGSI
jgi:hypothetical protein